MPILSHCSGQRTAKDHWFYKQMLTSVFIFSLCLSHFFFFELDFHAKMLNQVALKAAYTPRFPRTKAQCRKIIIH
jgi:hypothetical protein